MRRVDEAEGYRERAQHCIAIASRLSDQEQKLDILDLAMAWLRLAEQAKKTARSTWAMRRWAPECRSRAEATRRAVRRRACDGYAGAAVSSLSLCSSRSRDW
jgi:hypothetical protein